MKKQNKLSYFALGLQFTSSIIVPPIVCVYLGMYFAQKYNLGDWVMGVSVGTAALLMVTSLYSFAKTAVMISKRKDGESEEQLTAYELRKKRRD